MAIALEFVSVIVQKAAVERCYPGGMDGFAQQDLANLTEDDHLLRVGFMATSYALSFIDELEKVGLRCLGPEADSDIAVLVVTSGNVPPWLSVGRIDGQLACWATGYPAGDLAQPEPGFMLRCPRSVYGAISEVVRQCGAELRHAATEVEPGYLARLRCSRENAEITIDVFGECEDGSPVGLWGQRQLSRRKHFQADVALIRDVIVTLMQAGAEKP